MKRLLAPTFALLIALPTFGDEVISVGDEFLVNTYTTGNQGYDEIATDGAGNFIAVWEGDGDQDGDFWGVFGQRFAADGSPLGGEFQVNSFSLDYQVQPHVDAMANGAFVVVWQSYYQDANDDFDVFGQRFDSGGDPVGNEFQVNTYTTGYQGHATVAMSSSGGFLVVWESEFQDLSQDGLFGRLYDSDGDPVSGELQINTSTAGDQNDARAMPFGSGFLVVWESTSFDGDNEGVVMQEFDASASFVGDEMQVNTYTTGDQEDPELAIAADGTVAVVWESTGQDGSGDGVFGQVFDSNLQPVGQEFRANEATTANQEDASVLADGQGGFVVVWESFGLTGPDLEIAGRRFDLQGNTLGGEFMVNTEDVDDQDHPAIAGGTDGKPLLVAWRSFGGHDGSLAGVFGQRLEIALFADGFESGDLAAWSTSVP